MAEEQTKFKVVTLQERPGLEEIFWPQKERIWPEFMFHDGYAAKLWRYTWEVFDAFQVYLLNESVQPIAVGQTMPCVWDGTMENLPVGWADSLVWDVNDITTKRLN